MEDPANRRNGAFTSQNSSLSSFDYSDLTLSLPALPASEPGDTEHDKGSALFGPPTPTSQNQRYGSDMEDLSQWQCEFRGQIIALRQWLKSMEMRLPPLDPRGDFFRPQGDRGTGESDSIVLGLDSHAREVLGTGGPLHT